MAMCKQSYNIPQALMVCLTPPSLHSVTVMRFRFHISVELTPKGLRKMITRPSFAACPLDTFLFVKKWVDNHNEVDKDQLENILSHIPLSMLSISEICDFVRPTGLFSDCHIVNALIARENSTRQTRQAHLEHQSKNQVGHLPFQLVTTEITFYKVLFCSLK